MGKSDSFLIKEYRREIKKEYIPPPLVGKRKKKLSGSVRKTQAGKTKKEKPKPDNQKRKRKKD